MTQDIRVGRVPIDAIEFHQHNVRVDLGDLRDLTESIRRFGILQPVILEQRGQRLRIRAGHRRVAAARLAGLGHIPALIHGEALDDDEWLTAAVHENTRRRGLDMADRRRAVTAMRARGMTWDGIGDAFGVTGAAIRKTVETPLDRALPQPRPSGRAAPTARSSIRRSTLGTLAREARERVMAGAWTAEDVVAALELLSQSGRLSDALSPRREHPIEGVAS